MKVFVRRMVSGQIGITGYYWSAPVAQGQRLAP
jgi:hypothetical protein